jgi:hypothetical protein
MGAKKLYLVPENADAINAEISKIVGKHETYISFNDIKPKSYFSKKLLKNTIFNVYPIFSLPRAYKYQKKYGFVRCQHDGKNWYFLDCQIGQCFAGSRSPDNKYFFPKENEPEIMEALRKINQIVFI